jgi:hypothetical protein
MESLLVHPENKEQLKAIKAILKALKVKFEVQPQLLPAHVLKSIEISMKQYGKGQTISFEEFKKRHFTNYIPEKSADEIIDDLKSARNFKRPEIS